MENSFLADIATELINLNTYSNSTIVLPNKRAKLFFLNELKNQVDKTFFAPNVITIENLIETISELKNTDTIQLLFELYIVYNSINNKNPEKDNFYSFANWAKTIIQDFNEIDRYLINSNHLFSYLVDIERIKSWDLKPSDKIDLVENHLKFWKSLPQLYSTFKEHLLNKKIGYQGLLYRIACEKIDDFLLTNTTTFIFCGFNALNAAEEKIIKKCLNNNQAKIYWDIDAYFMQDEFHDAGYFLKRIKKNWSYFKTNSFNWTHNYYTSKKNIEIIATAKSVGQAKVVSSIIEKITNKNPDLSKTAVILSDEKLLLPILNFLPNSVSALNITMGYTLRNNPLQLFFSNLLFIHSNNIKNRNTSSFYYKDVLNVLQNPFIQLLINSDEVVDLINKNNITFLSKNRFEKFDFNIHEQKVIDLLFLNWENNALIVLENCFQFIHLLKNSFKLSEQENSLNLTFLFEINKIFIQLKSYLLEYDAITSIDELYLIYKQIIDQAEVSFEGEPLSGLQIMGILESRVLDFETVIITSLNEGKLPTGKSNNSFIPFDIRSELGLPTYKEKDAIFSYHFYHAIQRAKNVYLIYNTFADGLDSGEKSRFIRQIEIDKLPNHTISFSNFNAKIENNSMINKTIFKEESINLRLKEIATGKGFSPSSISTYLRNPYQFYLQRILNLKEKEEVEESIAVNTLGTIIHNVLELLYKPFINLKKRVEILDIEQMLKQVSDLTEIQFKEIYKEGNIDFGKNYLAFEVAKRNIIRFLLHEKELIEKGDELYIVDLERQGEFKFEHDDLPYSIKIAGKIDRVELRNNTLRIIDYKTGKVNARDLKVKELQGITVDLKKEKVVQLLIYSLMFEKEIQENKSIEIGIFSFKNFQEGYLIFNYNDNPKLNIELMKEFKSELVQVINEILDPKTPFKES